MSTPLFDPDDPRLTAYALGEATADERQVVEQILAASPEARAVVEQTRTLARSLEEDYLQENAAYQQAHPQPAMPANVIAFPGVRRRHWQPAIAWAWKIAAVCVAMGSLVWLANRRTPTAPVASIQPAAPKAIDETKPLESNDQLLAAATPDLETRNRAANLDARPSVPLTLAEPPPAAAPASADSSGAPQDADALLAQTSRDGASRLDESAPAPGGGRAGQAPASAEAPLLAAARPAAPPAALKSAPARPAKDRLEAAIVRLRQSDGTFVGGVLLTADGWILAARNSPVVDKPARMTVVLADQRELATTRDDMANPHGLLRIDASLLPSVRLAADAPDDGAALLAARVDSHTGETTITRARAKRIDGQTQLDGAASDADFVFNAAGELLAMEMAAPVAAKSAARARTVVRREVSTPLVVRPYTAAERAALTHPPR